MFEFTCRLCGGIGYITIIGNGDFFCCATCSTIFRSPTKFSLPVVRFIKLRPDAVIPSRATAGDVGYDVCSVMDDEVTLLPRQVTMIETGISVELPDNTEMQVRARSGMAKKYGIMVANAPGTIDTGYRGPCNVLLVNIGKEAYRISKGDKIAQFLITTKLPYKFVEVDSLGETERGEGGFGHTGK